MVQFKTSSGLIWGNKRRNSCKMALLEAAAIDGFFEEPALLGVLRFSLSMLLIVLLGVCFTDNRILLGVALTVLLGVALLGVAFTNCTLLGVCLILHIGPKSMGQACLYSDQSILYGPGLRYNSCHGHGPGIKT